MLLVFTCALIAVILVVIAWDVWSFRKVPPGPKGIPVIGLLPSQMNMPAMHLSYTELCRKYGGLVSLKMGNTLTVVVGSRTALREVLFSKGTQFAKRPYRRSYYIRSKGQTGIGFCSYGPEWKERRKVLHQTFFRAAVVNDLFQTKIYRSVNELLTTLFKAEQSQENLDLRTPFRLETSNVIVSVLNGKHLQPDDEEFKLRKQFAILNGELQGSFSLGDYFPQLSSLTDDEDAFHRFQELTDVEMRRHKESIDEHRKRISERSLGNSSGSDGDDGQDTDLQDILISLQEQERREKGKNVLFDDNALEVISSETIAGGTDTQAATMEWFILAMCNYPEVQRQLREEIDSVLQGAPPTGEDRKRLPFYTIVLYEIHRRWTILPLALPHCAEREVVVEGYRIPADTTIIVNQWALNHDAEVWPEPMQFKPERFKDMARKEIDNVMLSFGRGVRVCPGKPLAEIQLCIVLVTILQRFEIEAVLSPDQEKLDEDGVPGLIVFPKPYEIRLKRRNTMYPTLDYLPVE